MRGASLSIRGKHISQPMLIQGAHSSDMPQSRDPALGGPDVPGNLADAKKKGLLSRGGKLTTNLAAATESTGAVGLANGSAPASSRSLGPSHGFKRRGQSLTGILPSATFPNTRERPHTKHRKADSMATPGSMQTKSPRFSAYVGSTSHGPWSEKKSTLRTAMERLLGRKRRRGSVHPQNLSQQLVSHTEPNSSAECQDGEPTGVEGMSLPRLHPKRSMSMPIVDLSIALGSHSVGPEDISAIESARNSIQKNLTVITPTSAEPPALLRLQSLRSYSPGGLSPRPASSHSKSNLALPSNLRQITNARPFGNPTDIHLRPVDHTVRRRSRSLSGLSDVAMLAKDSRSEEIRYWRGWKGNGVDDPIMTSTWARKLHDSNERMPISAADGHSNIINAGTPARAADDITPQQSHGNLPLVLTPMASKFISTAIQPHTPSKTLATHEHAGMRAGSVMQNGMGLSCDRPGSRASGIDCGLLETMVHGLDGRVSALEHTVKQLQRQHLSAATGGPAGAATVASDCRETVSDVVLNHDDDDNCDGDDDDPFMASRTPHSFNHILLENVGIRPRTGPPSTRTNRWPAARSAVLNATATNSPSEYSCDRESMSRSPYSPRPSGPISLGVPSTKTSAYPTTLDPHSEPDSAVLSTLHPHFKTRNQKQKQEEQEKERKPVGPAISLSNQERDAYASLLGLLVAEQAARQALEEQLQTMSRRVDDLLMLTASAGAPDSDSHKFRNSNERTRSVTVPMQTQQASHVAVETPSPSTSRLQQMPPSPLRVTSRASPQVADSQYVASAHAVSLPPFDEESDDYCCYDDLDDFRGSEVGDEGNSGTGGIFGSNSRGKVQPQRENHNPHTNTSSIDKNDFDTNPRGVSNGQDSGAAKESTRAAVENMDDDLSNSDVFQTPLQTPSAFIPGVAVRYGSLVSPLTSPLAKHPPPGSIGSNGRNYAVAGSNTDDRNNHHIFQRPANIGTPAVASISRSFSLS